MSLGSQDCTLLKRRPLQIFLHLRFRSRLSRKSQFFCLSLSKAALITVLANVYLSFFVLIEQTQHFDLPYDSPQLIIIIHHVYSIINRKSLRAEQKMRSTIDETLKRRPSIEMAPSLERPVFIITKNMNGQHILSLTEELDKQKIAYQMQQQTNTLGFGLKQRFFVIVDNVKGEVTLGPEFGSILMSIIGYPRIGRNPKNKYFQKPAQIIAYYNKFKNDSDISQRQKTLIKSQYEDIIIETQSSAVKVPSKITVRSISKYKVSQKEQKTSENSLKEKAAKQCQRNKLLIIEDKSDQCYSKLCDDILQKISAKCLVQVVENMTELKRKTMFHTNKLNIYYLTNQRNEKEVTDTVTIGEVIVFAKKKEVNAFKKMINEMKIYAVCCEKDQTIRILQKVGFLFKAPSQLPENSNLKQQTAAKEIQKSSQLQEVLSKVNQTREEVPVIQISKIEDVHSIVNHNLQESSLNVSVLSNTSTNQKKIKRLKPTKSKIKPPQNSLPDKQESEYYPTSKKENVYQMDQKGVLRKKTTLKSQDKGHMQISKSKKSLKFIDEVVKPSSRLRRIKSVQKCDPQTVRLQVEDNTAMTNTDEEYFSMALKSKAHGRSSLQRCQPQASNFDSYFPVQSSILEKNKIHGIFYRQFIPKFHNIVHLIKMKPSGLFFNKTTLQYYQPYLNPKQFDRSARKLKQKLHKTHREIQNFNFVLFVLQEQVQEFQRYFQLKNASYQQELSDLQTTIRATNSSFFGSKGFKVNIYMFVDSERQVQDRIIDLGKIRVAQMGLQQVLGRELREDASEKIGQKVESVNRDSRLWVQG